MTSTITPGGSSNLAKQETTGGSRACERPSSQLVSVIIPTLNRPALLKRALESVVRQTWRELEVIVVVDGPDPDTVAFLEASGDPRLHIIQNPRSLTAAGARNAGIELAKGEWIAFLDDDDEWMPEKLAKQLAYAEGRGPALLTCLSCVVTSGGSFVRPQVVYDNLLPIDEYLFDRPSPFAGCGFIQTSTYLLPRRSAATCDLGTTIRTTTGISCCDCQSNGPSEWRPCQRS